MKNLITAVLLMLPAIASAQSRPLATCDQAFLPETRQVAQASVEALPIPTNGINNSSGTWKSESRLKCIRNNDSTAGNYIFISSFSLANSTVDTGKAWPIPGGNTEDANFCFPVGSSIRLWVTRAVGSGTFTAFLCK